jgi:SAM-dependent methyltransferase
MKLYEDLAEFYFAIESHHRNFDQDISFIRSFIPPGTIASILDIGCGTGEHIEAFARDGYMCTGIDSSDSMLAVAKKRSTGHAIFQKHSLTDFDFFEEFHLLISLFGSMDYLLTDEEFDAVLWNIWRALKPGGIAILEIWNSFPVLQISEKALGFVSSTRAGNTVIDRERGFKVVQKNPVLVDVSYRYHIRDGLQVRMIEDIHRMRAFSLDEFELFAAKNGFRIHSLFANTARNEFTKISNKIVAALEK